MKKVLKYIIILIFLSIIILLGINFYVKKSTESKLIYDYEEIKNIDCILVLGAGVKNDRPSLMLQDRLEKAIELYKDNISSKILVSGDHGKKEYDEVNIMKDYLISNGIPSEDIFMDHAGFSTYDSIYRTKEIFKADKMVIISQEYHLYRALYISNKLGIKAYGVRAQQKEYVGDNYREIREILARIKDFLKCIFKPKPKYLGEEIPVSGSGDVTNDK